MEWYLTSMKISELISNSRTLRISVHGNAIEFNYKPGVFTPEYNDRFQEIKKKSDDADKLTDEEQAEKNKENENQLISMICDLLTKWDIMEDDETTMYPIKVDSLRKVPYLVLNAIMESIIDDISPKKKTSDS